MLERVRQLLATEKESNIPFQQFYVQYMIEVQDSNIDSEVTSAFKKMSVEINTLKKVDTLIDSQHRKMVK